MFNVRRMGSVMYFQFKTCWHSPRFIWVISTWGGGCSSEILPFLDGSNMGASSAHSMVQKVECGANTCWLVVWNIFLFFHILGIVTPTDFHIFQRGGSTTNQHVDSDYETLRGFAKPASMKSNESRDIPAVCPFHLLIVHMYMYIYII